jgi:hypothetical protein
MAKLAKGTFNAVWADYALEVTENKALKGTGGIIGLTLKGTALARYFLARPVTAKYSMLFHEEVCHKAKNDDPGRNLLHHTDNPSYRKRWDTAVGKMNTMFETYVDPYDLSNAPPHLVNFTTAAIANPEVEKSMMGYIEKGKEMATKFVTDRLVRGEDEQKAQKSFYDPLPRSGVKTMADMKVPLRVKGRNVTFDNGMMYMRLLAVNAHKRIPIQRVMSYENSIVPLSMFADDGSLLLPKSKSDFMHKLEELLPENIRDLDSADCVIFDGHAIIQMLPFPASTENATFKDMAAHFMNFVHSVARTVGARTLGQIHVVFDRYLPKSIKSQTRQKRGDFAAFDADTAGNYHVVLEGKVHANKDVFLSRSKNKVRLAKVYTQYINTQPISNGLEIYASGGDNNNATQIENLPFLNSNQEESDTRIILHSIAAAQNGANTIVVRSPDTDVLVLLLHHRPAIKAKRIFCMTGTDSKHTNLLRFVPVHELYQKLTREQHAILMPIYCLTGCDTTSSFFSH